MEAIALIFSRFSSEILGAEAAMLFAATALGMYWMLLRKKKKEAAEWVPAALVKAYLDRMRSDEYETRVRLFGEAEASSYPGAHAAGTGQQMMQQPVVQMMAPMGGANMDQALLREVEALRAQLAMSDVRTREAERMVQGAQTERAVLEGKVREAQRAADVANAAAASAGSGGGGASIEQLKELEEMRARLREYEVIEDDLANLKNYRKELDTLRMKVSQFEKGGASVSMPAAAPVAPAPAPVAVIAPPPPAPAPVAVAPAPAPAKSAAPEVDSGIIQAASPPEAAPAPAFNATPAAAPAASAASDKAAPMKEEELLSEFEKMLAS